MANTITINVLGNTRGFQNSIKGVQGDLGRLGQASSKAGSFLKSSMKVAAVGFGAAGVAIGKLAKDSISAASDAQQSLGATETVFGKAASDIIKWSNKAATKYGLDANTYRENSNLIGSLFKNQGVAVDQLAGKTDKMIGIGADLAATFGGTTTDAVEALGAAFKGEYDQLERYGISLKQSDVNALLAARGQDKLTGAAKTAAEQQAKTDLIMKQSAQSTGAFKKESDTLAHQQQVLAARFENVKAKLGTALLPIITKVMGVIAKEGIPALERFAAWFKKEGPDAIDSAVQAFTPFVKVIADVAQFVGQHIKLFVGLVAAFYAITAAVAAYNVVLTAYKAIATAIKVATIVWRNAQLALNLAMMLNPVGLVIAAIVALVAIFVIAYKKSETFRNIVNASWEAIKKATSAVFGWMKDFIKGAFDFLKNLFMNFTGPGLIIKHWDKIKSATSAAWNAVKNAVKAVWDWLKNTVGSVFGAIKDGVTRAWDGIKSATSNAWNAAKNLVSDAWNAMKNAVQNGVNAVVNFVKSLPGKIKGVFAGAAGWLLQAGKNIIQGLLNGIGDMIGSVKSKLGELTNMIPNWKGPASKDKRLLRPVGKMIMKGLIDGFDDGREGIKKSLGQITDLIHKTMDKRFKDDKAADAASKRVINNLKDEVRHMMENAKARENMVDRIAKAEERLNEIRKTAADYAASIAGSVLDFGNIGGLGKDAETGAVSIGGILGDLRNKVTDAKTYKSVLDQLIAMGLNKTTLDQLAQMGVEGGLATAQAIVSGGKEAINEVNALTKQLQATGKSMGKTLSTEMYGAGIEMAKGMLKGLKSRERELIEQAKDLARQLAAAVKKELGIKSPSRVFRRLGENTVKGLEIGLRDTNGVERAMVRLSQAMVNGFDRPALSATATGGTGSNVTVTVNVPPTADKASIGREIQKTLDEYYRTGGIRRA